MTTRRGFLGGILAAGFAPAAIGSGVLMPVRKVLTPADIERALHDYIASRDGAWIKAYLDAIVFGTSGYTVRVGPDGVISGFGLSATDWPKVQAVQDEKNRRGSAMLLRLGQQLPETHVSS